MNVLSLFDGMSCGQIALKELGIEPDIYYASEIDKFAIKQTQLNFPNTIQLGDVRDIKATDLGRIDLILAGSPYTNLSFASNRRRITMLNENDKTRCLTSAQYHVNLETNYIPTCQRKPVRLNRAIESGKSL